VLIVGELINSSRKIIAQSLQNKDSKYLLQLAQQQGVAGAHYLYINTALGGDEIESMNWVIDLIQKEMSISLCLDSQNPVALEQGLVRCLKRPMINSISAAKERWDSVLPLAKEFKAKVVALCMDDSGIPDTVQARLQVAKKLVQGLNAAGIDDDDIYLDPLVKPIGVNHKYGSEILESIRAIKEAYPHCHLISGLSQVSYGLPERRLLNRTYMVMSIAQGMDAFILDPLDQTLMSLFAAAKALAGKDEDCMDYISGVRAGKVKS